jgi:two-component system chemotaxis sensor kinase CheA
MDRSMVERIEDPLMHMIRNAVDHGIEAPEQRARAGKPEAGRITLVARRGGGQVVIELTDDGKGLDRDRILAKAIERGRSLKAEDLSEELMAELIFEPGFSTAAEVTDVSGRGVGMDVVRNNILALRGRVLVRSESAKGSTFEIQVPLALAIVQGFHVTVGDNCFVLPAECVERCLEAPAIELLKNGPKGGECVRFNGRLLPLLRLSGALGIALETEGRRPAVVVRCGGELIALGVDTLRGEQQTVVRSLGPVFQSIRPVSGATVLGNGEIALLLDVPRIVEAARTQLSS